MPSPAHDAGLRLGDEVVSRESPSAGHGRDPVARMLQWREAYWAGPGGPVRLTVRAAGGTRTVQLERPAVWGAPCATVIPWMRVHAGLLIQVMAFIGAGALLLALRPRDATAQFNFPAGR